MAENAPDTAPDGRSASPAGSGEPSQLLREVDALRRQTRRARHAYWFPLVLFGVLTCAAVPFYILRSIPVGEPIGFAVRVPGPLLPMLGGESEYLFGSYLAYYWLAAIAAGLTLTALWYRRQASRVGLTTPTRGYLVTCAALTVAALAVPVASQVTALRFLDRLWPADLIIRGTFPFLIIAAGLGALAWAERSRALAAVTTLYAGTALLVSLYDIGNVLPGLAARSQALPVVLLPALILLAAGAGAFAVQRGRSAA